VTTIRSPAAAIDEIYTEDWRFLRPSKGVYRGVMKSASSRRDISCTLKFSDTANYRARGIGQWAGWSAGYQGARVRRQLTRDPIPSLPGTAGIAPFISFSEKLA